MSGATAVGGHESGDENGSGGVNGGNMHAWSVQDIDMKLPFDPYRGDSSSLSMSSEQLAPFVEV